MKPFARLPSSVVPSKYFLDYTVDLDHFRFQVHERVVLAVHESTREITCHALELYVLDVAVRLDGRDKAMPCTEMRYRDADQTITLVFDHELPAGATAELMLTCHGTLNDKLQGFYRSAYAHELAGETRVMAVTQFEACDARRAFVCWDEPALKATFELSVTCAVHLTAISNTHVVQTLVRPRATNAHLWTRSRPMDARLEKVWRFAETPVMSTYLVGMVVGEFDVVSTVTTEGVVVSVYTPVGRSDRGHFALDVGARALSFYTHKFGLAYPLTKLDMVAIPDFAAGAMENWGVVTYRETRLLIDAQLSSVSQQLATARTVCHELAHQWFGNLVTMAWWTGLWLNEGFARYGNAETQDLWKALEHASGQDMLALATTWTRQTGFPMVTLREDGQLVQERCWADPRLKEATVDALGVVWAIPLTFVSSENPHVIERVGILPHKASRDDAALGSAIATTLCVPAQRDGEEKQKWWIKLNANQTGFYLVNYSVEGWQRLEQPVRDKILGPIDRMSLLSTMFAFARSGAVPVSRALAFSRAYVTETEHLCWKELASQLRFFCALFRREAFYPQLQTYIRRLFASIMAQLTWNASEGESTLVAPFRRDVISMLVVGDDPHVIAEAQRLFHAYFRDKGRAAVAADVRAVVFQTQARHGDAGHWAQLRDCYESSTFIEEKLDCLRAMGLFESLELKHQVLTWAFQTVRSQDIHIVCSSVAATVRGADCAWHYVCHHWTELNAQYRPLIVGRIVLAVIASFQTEAHARDVETFLATRHHACYAHVLDAAVERIRVKSACYERTRDDVATWLEAVAGNEGVTQTRCE
ncbi:hypothetical protein PsorP6_009486 [Peronosclerospora sorghi]|uniref:Uncharacterized protein n=1 Tax=Peronosclerospora sorghi TaxID=230839 RepID=A0ACC0VXV5_9STRA|nr:hypothetical protein PsorP6_009486 [Peronosclerospora sorghi]